MKEAAPAPEPAAPRTLPLDDVQLLAAVRAGDDDAAEALCDRLSPRIEATVTRLLGRHDPDHEDCVQVAFVELIRSIDNFRGESSLEHWCSRIAAHVVYKHIRQRRGERRIFERGARTSDRPEAVSSARRVLFRDLADRIQEKIAAITPEKAYAFLLHDVLGFDLREIAQITSVSVAAAQQRLVRGRREVRAHLAADAELAAVLEELEEP